MSTRVKASDKCDGCRGKGFLDVVMVDDDGELKLVRIDCAYCEGSGEKQIAH